MLTVSASVVAMLDWDGVTVTVGGAFAPMPLSGTTTVAPIVSAAIVREPV